MKLYILGFKHSKGEFEGRSYDYVVLFSTAKMEQKDNQRGSAGIDMRGDSILVEQLNKMNFSAPVLCEIEKEPRAIGKGQTVDTVVSCVPVALSQPKPNAAS